MIANIRRMETSFLFTEGISIVPFNFESSSMDLHQEIIEQIMFTASLHQTDSSSEEYSDDLETETESTTDSNDMEEFIIPKSTNRSEARFRGKIRLMEQRALRTKKRKKRKRKKKHVKLAYKSACKAKQIHQEIIFRQMLLNF